jgi:hypothetical protein
MASGSSQTHPAVTEIDQRQLRAFDQTEILKALKPKIICCA